METNSVNALGYAARVRQPGETDATDSHSTSRAHF